MNDHHENYGVARRSDDPPRLPRQRQRWVRAGTITGMLWAVALIVAFLSTSPATGSARTLPWFALIPGFVVLWLVGRRLQLHGPSSWFLAGGVAAVVVMLIFPLLGILWALAGFPGVGRY